MRNKITNLNDPSAHESFRWSMKRDSQFVHTETTRNYISKKFLASARSLLFFSLQGPTRSAKRRVHTKHACVTQFVRLSCASGIQVRRRVSYSLASRRNIASSRHRFFLRDYGTITKEPMEKGQRD